MRLVLCLNSEEEGIKVLFIIVGSGEGGASLFFIVTVDIVNSLTSFHQFTSFIIFTAVSIVTVYKNTRLKDAESLQMHLSTFQHQPAVQPLA